MIADLERKPFQQSSHAALLEAFLRGIAESGDRRVIAFAELMSVANLDDRETVRNMAYRIRERICRDKSRYFVAVHGVGIKLCTDAEAAGIAGSSRGRILRAARRGRQRSSTASMDALANNDKLSLMANQAILGLIERSAAPIAAKRISAAIERAGPKLCGTEILKLAEIA